MKTLVRPSNRIKEVGTTSKVYKSSLDKIEIGDLVEITNQDNETLNVARVIDIELNQTIVIEMIA